MFKVIYDRWKILKYSEFYMNDESWGCQGMEQIPRYLSPIKT